MTSLACIKCKKFVPIDYSDVESVKSGEFFSSEHAGHSVFVTNEVELKGYEEIPTKYETRSPTAHPVLI